MPMLLVSKLPEMKNLSLSLYDPESGELVLARGEELSKDIIGDFATCGYEQVFASNDQGEVDLLRRNNTFTSMSLLSIKPDTIMASDLYDETGTFLVAKGTRLSATILSSLARRKVHNVLIRKELPAECTQRLNKIRLAISSRMAKFEMPQVKRQDFTPDELISDPSALNARSIQKVLQQLETSGKLEVTFDPKESLGRLMIFNDPFQVRDEKKKFRFVDIYQDLLKRTEQLFERLKNSVSIESRLVLEMCDELIRALVSDRELLLCSMFTPHQSSDYLAQHSLNVAIIAVNIATAHGYSPKMVVEVGYGALLMDIGMLDINQDIRFKRERLTLLEINELKRHTIYGMDRLQYIHHLPKTTPLVAYQSHERLDGSGYPHGKRMHAIHDYAKIVAVSDVYHAMIAQRPYRQTQTLPYKAMEELLALASKNKLDRRFVRSLLAAMSLFPVASWVKLNTGEVARVLRANDKDFTRPYIVILFNASGEVQPPVRINLSDDPARQVQTAVKMEEQHVMVGF